MEIEEVLSKGHDVQVHFCGVHHVTPHSEHARNQSPENQRQPYELASLILHLNHVLIADLGSGIYVDLRRLLGLLGGVLWRGGCLGFGLVVGSGE